MQQRLVYIYKHNLGGSVYRLFAALLYLIVLEDLDLELLGQNKVLFMIMNLAELEDIRKFRGKVLWTTQKQNVRGRSQAWSQTHSDQPLHCKEIKILCEKKLA